jgi:eukaryotic-like serine/threonine-protein kinase
VYRLADLQIEERNRSNDYKCYFIGTMFHSSIIMANDSVLYEFQEQEEINKEAVFQLIKNLRKNKHREVGYRL